ncbi:uncharacterized protein EKO05_0000259 [Ascochyta rabiei]|uniref:Uncharacterized protein n=1 Tax=Didymella rabiei TaxID=5454 RepID=A0A163E2J9_DIDRA|nr:uncharacterized protein EKO05_0000259 [Ascochyta rabiei]KZM23480.1 hypothetical protein ST47_g5345 [Ascochyta rabiei]UPX09572.1 hypothetical protein EKO05_0000259 [Ascochyta rabiei]
MSPKRKPKTQALPTPAPENISNREYYRASETTDTSPHADELMEFPPGPPAEEQQDGSGERSEVQSREQDDGGFVELSRPGRPSPSPSDIVARCELEDARAMGDLERSTRGLERRERKRLLIALQERRRRDREVQAEEGERRGGEERNAEYDEMQRKGREEV